MSTKTIQLIRDGEKGGRGEGGAEVGGEGDYIPMATVTTRVTPALRLAAMTAILMFH